MKTGLMFAVLAVAVATTAAAPGLHLPGEEGNSFGTITVMQIDGEASPTVTAMLQPEDCGEEYKDYKISGLNPRIATMDDVVVEYSSMDLEPAVDTDGTCLISTMNVTMSITVDKFVGSTPLTLTIETEKDGMVKTYPLSGTLVVAGITIYSEGGDGVTIHSGADRSYPLGNYEDILASPVSVLKVATQGADGSAVDSSSIEMTVEDEMSEEWQRYFEWSESCPAAYLTKKADGSPNFDAENGQCNIGFAEDMSFFALKMNPYRVGCGYVCAVIEAPSIQMDGENYMTRMCYEIDLNPAPPVVVDCSDEEVDFFGIEAYAFDAFNLVMCNVQRYQNNVNVSMKLGDTNLSPVAMRLNEVDQIISFETPDFPSTGSTNPDRIVDSNNGTASFVQDDGTVLDVQSKVFCINEGTEGTIKARYQGAELAQSTELANLGETETELEIQIALPEISEKTFTEFRGGKMMKAFNLENIALVGKQSAVSNKLLVTESCTTGMCGLRNLATRMTNMVNREEEAESNLLTIKLRAPVEADQFEETKAGVLAMEKDFAARVNAIQAKITHVGVATNNFNDGGLNVDGGVSPSIIAVAVVGLISLFALVAAIVYLVLVANTDEATTDSDWSEGGVSVDGVPVPSSRYYDAVIVDNYGRGDAATASELRAERPTSAADPRS